jgi:hypothetical protein
MKRNRYVLALVALHLAAAAGASSVSAVLDVGEVQRGANITVCARFHNTGTAPLHIKDAGPPGYHFAEFVLFPGTDMTVHLRPIDTRGFSGPITKALSLWCDPEPTLTIHLFRCEQPSPEP